MQRYTIFLIVVSALHVSGGFSAHHQELKNCTQSIWYVPGLLGATALHVSGGLSVHHQELKNCTHSIWYVPGLLAATASGSSKQAWYIPDAVCTVHELLMMGGETARNM
jgi:hypothetical protein